MGPEQCALGMRHRECSSGPCRAAPATHRSSPSDPPVHPVHPVLTGYALKSSTYRMQPTDQMSDSLASYGRSALALSTSARHAVKVNRRNHHRGGMQGSAPGLVRTSVAVRPLLAVWHNAATTDPIAGRCHVLFLTPPSLCAATTYTQQTSTGDATCLHRLARACTLSVSTALAHRRQRRMSCMHVKVQVRTTQDSALQVAAASPPHQPPAVAPLTRSHVVQRPHPGLGHGCHGRLAQPKVCGIGKRVRGASSAD